jgi:hypothetical protein
MSNLQSELPPNANRTFFLYLSFQNIEKPNVGRVDKKKTSLSLEPSPRWRCLCLK